MVVIAVVVALAANVAVWVAFARWVGSLIGARATEIEEEG